MKDYSSCKEVLVTPMESGGRVLTRGNGPGLQCQRTGVLVGWLVSSRSSTDGRFVSVGLYK